MLSDFHSLLSKDIKSNLECTTHNRSGELWFCLDENYCRISLHFIVSQPYSLNRCIFSVFIYTLSSEARKQYQRIASLMLASSVSCYRKKQSCSDEISVKPNNLINK